MKIVVKQNGGLGNQLFQYAAGLYYARRYSATAREVIIPERDQSYGYARPFLLPKFRIRSPYREFNYYDRMLLMQRSGARHAAALLRGVARTEVFREDADCFTFREDFPLKRLSRTVYLVGYWQAYRYADEMADDLRGELSLLEAPEGRNLEVLKEIEGASYPVSLHIRRGDYTLAATGNLALPMEYYRSAIRLLQERVMDATFFVFSDDVAFARENLTGANFVFVDHNDDFSAQEDLRLMSSCRSHIIANSSFSWWGAWLNPREDKIVIVPKFWQLSADSFYPDLLPPLWIAV